MTAKINNALGWTQIIDFLKQIPQTATKSD